MSANNVGILEQAKLIKNLLETIPVAAKDDPATSHEAEADVNARGARGRQIVLILDLLKSRPASTLDLLNFAPKYSGRISDLRRMGYIISAKRVGEGEWIYTLEGRGEPKKPKVNRLKIAHAILVDFAQKVASLAEPGTRMEVDMVLDARNALCKAREAERG
jgi:hypothetical protein